MKGFTKANTLLKRELQNKITDVLQSFAYDEIAGDANAVLADCLKPIRYYTVQDFTVTAVIEGERNLLADAEMAAVAINAMLGAEIENPNLKVGHSKLPYALQGELSVLDAIQEESDALDTVYALFDLMEGYGLNSYLSVDLTLEKFGTDISFACYAGAQCLCRGGRQQNSVSLIFDLAAITEYKLGGKELKEPASVVLVASDMAENAYKVAFGLRRQGLKTEGYISGGSMFAAEEYCDLKGIPTLIWVAEHKVIMKNVQSGETAETTLEKLLGK